MSPRPIDRLIRVAALAACVALAACGGSADETPPLPPDTGSPLTDAASATTAANASAQIAVDASTLAAAAGNAGLAPAQRANDAIGLALRMLAQSDSVQRLHPGAGSALVRPALIPMPAAALLAACVGASGTAVIDATVNCSYVGPAGETIRITGTVRIAPGAVDIRLAVQVVNGSTTINTSIEVVLTLGATSLDGRVNILASVNRNGIVFGHEQSVRFENIAWDGCANNRPHAGALEARQTMINGANRVSFWVRVSFGPACGQVAIRIGT